MSFLMNLLNNDEAGSASNNTKVNYTWNNG
jgi:hypothetical protein